MHYSTKWCTKKLMWIFFTPFLNCANYSLLRSLIRPTWSWYNFKYQYLRCVSRRNAAYFTERSALWGALSVVALGLTWVKILFVFEAGVLPSRSRGMLNKWGRYIAILTFIIIFPPLFHHVGQRLCVPALLSVTEFPASFFLRKPCNIARTPHVLWIIYLKFQ